MPRKRITRPLPWSLLQGVIANDPKNRRGTFRGVLNTLWAVHCPEHLVLERHWLKWYLSLIHLRPPLSRRAAWLNPLRCGDCSFLPF